MSYAVKEIFYTLQGEGAQAGRAAVFCRFAGCNLWSGREEDRAQAVCNFCDTDFVGTDGQGGGKFKTAEDLANAIAAKWPSPAGTQASGRPYVVCTGGEPLLQVDEALITALHARDFEIAVETNGTQAAPEGLDWICVSPKADAEVVLTRGHELKLVYPQPLAQPERFAGLDFQHFFLQPMDSVLKAEHTRAAIHYCMTHPQWRLSVQMHKVVGIE
ncbi:MAG: 7-carboxy-7-deazaguanine synthase [Burkholderiaceae bacterium]|nr:7-carboxy-7-deazaguanine synthase [Burkholderiaceae bacterium]